MWGDNRRANIHITEVPREERESRTRYIFEDMLAENFLKLVRGINIHIQEAAQIPNRINPSHSMAGHIINVIRQGEKNNFIATEKKGTLLRLPI